jgi:hypothetical protein
MDHLNTQPKKSNPVDQTDNLTCYTILREHWPDFAAEVAASEFGKNNAR